MSIELSNNLKGKISVSSILDLLIYFEIIKPNHKPENLLAKAVKDEKYYLNN